MNCKICQKPIVLSPSAAVRAQRFGGKPSDYTKLFTTHATCQLEKNRKSVRELMSRV